MKKIKKELQFLILIFIALTQIFPLYWLITFSLKTNNEIFGDNVLGLPETWRWVNYTTALNDGGILLYFMNSVIYSGLTVLVVGILTAMAAYAIARMHWKTKHSFFYNSP